MKSNAASTKVSTDRFWDKFIAALLKQGVKEAEARWCVLRAEQYIRAFPDKRLADHSVDDVREYLESAGLHDKLTDWQFVQAVSAIQNLLRTAKAPVVEEVDWAYWCDSARTLTPDHPTVARDGGQSGDDVVSGERFKEKRNIKEYQGVSQLDTCNNAKIAWRRSEEQRICKSSWLTP